MGKIVVIPILLIGLLIVIKSLDYYSPDFSNGFLSDKKAEFRGLYKIAFYSHIIFMPIILFIGTFQVFFNRKKRGGKLHRCLGKLYVLLVLVVAMPSGVIMSFKAFGGWISILNFFILSILTFIFTYLAYKTIVKGNVVPHNQYITRSYLLIISAVLLRLFSFISVHYFNWNGENMYIIISWLSWLPSLLIYEVYCIIKIRKEQV